MEYKKLNPLTKIKENLDHKSREELFDRFSTEPCLEFTTIRDGYEKKILLSYDEALLRVLDDVDSKMFVSNALARKIALAEAYEAFVSEPDNYEFDLIRVEAELAYESVEIDGEMKNEKDNPN